MIYARSILVAVDGSPASREAVEIALSVAAANAARVTFVHGSGRLKAARFDRDPGNVETAAELRELDTVLRDALASAAAQDVEADALLVGEEHPHELVPAILGLAEATLADLIVVGCRGRGWATSSLLGSVSHALIRTSKVPVLVVGGPRRAADRRRRPVNEQPAGRNERTARPGRAGRAMRSGR